MLAVQERVAPCEACTPVPLRLIRVGEFVALLTTETVPLKLLALVGEKAMDNVALCPAVRIDGGIDPVVLKLFPDTVVWAMVTLELPVLVIVAVCVALLPTVTFPKLKLVGLADNWSVAAIPVPFKEISTVGFVASLINEIVPVALPGCAGANFTVAVALWPAGIFIGGETPVMLKPDPEIEA